MNDRSRIRLARAILKMSKGWVLPLRATSKVFHKGLSLELRGVPGWKNGEDGKPHPNSYFNRKTSEAELLEWFKLDPEVNIGVFTGSKSGIHVADIDHPEAIDIDRVLSSVPGNCIVSTYRGYQLYCRSDHPLRTTKIPGIGEIRGNGGYVMAPPSVHPRGTQYAFSGDEFPGVEELPLLEALMELICPKTLTLPSSAETPHNTPTPNVLGHRIDFSGVVDVTSLVWRSASLRERVATLLSSDILIAGLLERLGVNDRATKNISCPYHRPDRHSSMAVTNAGNGYAFFDWHSDEPEGYEIIPVVQLYVDLVLGFFDGHHHRHMVFQETRPTLEANIWLARIAIETGAVKSAMPNMLSLSSFTAGEKKVLDAVGFLYQCRELMFPKDASQAPIAWSWLARWTFLGEYQQHPERRAALEKRVGRTLIKARDKGHIVTVEKGSGWKKGEKQKAASYRLGTELDVLRIGKRTNRSDGVAFTAEDHGESFSEWLSQASERPAH